MFRAQGETSRCTLPFKKINNDRECNGDVDVFMYALLHCSTFVRKESCGFLLLVENEAFLWPNCQSINQAAF